MTSRRPNRWRASLIAASTAATSGTSKARACKRSGYAVGMHKSALLRYFETREQIFLRLTAEGWQEWSAALRAKLERAAGSPIAERVAAAFSTTLADRGMFCDLLAQAPLNLERNVSLEAVRAFKLVTHTEVDAIVQVIRPPLPALTQL